MRVLRIGTIVVISTLVFSLYTQMQLLVIDTGFNEPYTYRNFLLLAESVGFIAELKQFYEINPVSFKNYDCIIVAIDPYFEHDYFKHKNNLNGASPITQSIVSLLQALKNCKNSLIGFMLPPKMGNGSTNSYEQAYNFCSTFFTMEKHVKRSLLKFLRELMQPDYRRSLHYHTTLLTKPEKIDRKLLLTPKTSLANCIHGKTKRIITGHLPYYAFHNWLPLAWFSCHMGDNAHFFVTKASLLLFSDIEENFSYNPLDFSLRTKKLCELHQLLCELYCIAQQRSLPKDSQPITLKLPYLFTKDGVLDSKKKYSAIRAAKTDAVCDWLNKEEIWCGFCGLEPYTNEHAVANIVNSKLNLIWLELYPEWYLADDGLKCDQKQTFLNLVDQFAKRLWNISKEKQCNPPSIFIGTGLTSNFAKKIVKNPVVDAYGTCYTKVPSPLDEACFWQNEVFDVIDRFASEWKKLGNENTSVGGIFIDLEMYHAPNQAGHYAQTMDFSDIAWDCYCAKMHNKDLYKLKDHAQRILYLLQHKDFGNYFAQLHERAYKIGLELKTRIRSVFPKALIAVYDIHLPHNWFYKGLLAGLSDHKRPVILATFNNDFYSHYSWLSQNNIHVYHLPALLLSKLQTKKDFDLIGDIAQYHDGMWFNRFSRIEESRNPKDWSWDYGLEVTPLPAPMVVSGFHNAICKIQSKNAMLYNK